MSLDRLMEGIMKKQNPTVAGLDPKLSYIPAHIKAESFGFEAQKYNEKMIVVTPQLSDWGETLCLP